MEMEKIIRSCQFITSFIVGWNSASVFRNFLVTFYPKVENANAIPLYAQCLLTAKDASKYSCKIDLTFLKKDKISSF